MSQKVGRREYELLRQLEEVARELDDNRGSPCGCTSARKKLREVVLDLDLVRAREA